MSSPAYQLFFFLRFCLFIFRERGRERERKGEKHQCVVASHMAPTAGLARNPGTCPAWEPKRATLGFAAHALSTEPHQPGLNLLSQHLRVLVRCLGL